MKKRLFLALLIFIVVCMSSCDTVGVVTELTAEETPFPTTEEITVTEGVQEIKIYTEYDGGALILERGEVHKNGTVQDVLYEKSFEYDEEGHVKGVLYKNKDSFSYIYDSSERVVSVTRNGELYVEYEYSKAGYLIREDNAGDSKTYVFDYDEKGNITSREIYPYKNTEGEAEERLDYTYEKGLLVSFSENKIEYNSLGNPTLLGDKTEFIWGERLLEAVVIGEDRVEYTYGSFSQRSTKKYGTREFTYVWKGMQLSSMIVTEADGSRKQLNFTYNSEGVPAVLEFDGELYYYVTDLFGTVTGIGTRDGIAVSYQYDAWGKALNKEVSNGEYAELAELNPIRYKGYVYDEETELYYLQTRYYSPKICRKIGADGYLPSRNESYIYGDNDPVNRVDNTMSVKHPICNDLHLYRGNESPVAGKINVSFKPYGENPVFQIENSYRITDGSQQRAILMYIMESDLYDAEVYCRTLPSMLEEWRAHNHIYAASPNERCQHVDFDRNDEGVTYSEFWKRAAKEYGINTNN